MTGKLTHRTLADFWEGYRRAVIPPGTSTAEIRNSQFAFYGGASYVLDLLLLVIGSEAVTEDEGVAMLERLRQELHLFAAQQGALLKPGD